VRARNSCGIVSRATQQGDFAAVLDRTNPNAIALLGGRQQAITILKAAMEELKSNGFRVTSFDIGQPSQPITSNQKLFSVIPTTMAMTLRKPHTRLTQKSFVVAISLDDGATWTFADGGTLTPSALSVIIPDLPSELRLPKPESPSVEHLK
jgi:hypothetical protein